MAIDKPLNKDEKTQLQKVSILLAVATTIFVFLLYKKWVNSKEDDQDIKAETPGGLGAVGGSISKCLLYIIYLSSVLL